MRMTFTPAMKSARVFCLWFVTATAILLAAASPLRAQQPSAVPPPTVVFMTDFGVLDDSVGPCRALDGFYPHPAGMAFDLAYSS